jgi:lipopolysaccharide/colanic/teichoic acid biosynthesis glycosyltransferase
MLAVTINPENVMSLITKKLCDSIFAFVLIVLLLPIFCIVSILIYLEMGNPIFFYQPRPGRNAQVFHFYKFRTMSNAVDANGNLLPDAQRITSLGMFLRKSSIDELPQLLNVFKGDMSFVGPRPLLVRYLDRYTSEQARRHLVLPGITGWAQVNGRNSLSWEDKFGLDTWYVDHWNLMLDLKILFLTLVKVVRREGISSGNHVTMEEFHGDVSVK